MKTIFTNGVWDIFHYGHYNLLRRAKEYGDYLLVGVASDESCTKYKRKPHQTWKIRANSVRNLSFVNEVIKTPWSRDITEDFYKRYDIDFQVQGDDSSGFDLARKQGLLRILGRTEGISTTHIEEVIESNDNKILTGGYINDIKQAFADNKLYVIKCGIRDKGKLYNINAPPTRIYNEYESIMTFRKYIHNPSYVANPICFDPDSYTIVFESAPKQATLLSDMLLRNEVDFNAVKSISKGLVEMHNATLEKKELLDKFSDTEGFLKLKVETQCLNITDDEQLKKYIKNFSINSLKIKKVLLHGDIAPKNIMVWDNRFLFIDFEECAYSDPAIDIGYLIAHFYLHKIITNEEHFSDAIKIIYDTYMSGINYDDPTFEERISKYIGIFMLSRIDGEAKAKYIKKEEDKENIRDIARKFILGKIILEEKVGDYPRGVIEINS